MTIDHRGWDSLPAGHPERHGLTGTAFTSLICTNWGDLIVSLQQLIVSNG